MQSELHVHEKIGPAKVSVHVNFNRNAVASKNILTWLVVAAVPVHPEISWLNADAL